MEEQVPFHRVRNYPLVHYSTRLQVRFDTELACLRGSLFAALMPRCLNRKSKIENRKLQLRPYCPTGHEPRCAGLRLSRLRFTGGFYGK
jgi:hypothetical protein